MLGMFSFMILINDLGLPTQKISLAKIVTSAVKDGEHLLPRHFKYFDDLTYLESINLEEQLEKIPDDCLVRPLEFQDRTGHHLPAQNTVLQGELDNLHEYSTSHQMVVNLKKSKAMSFNPNRRSRDFKPLFNYNGNNLKIVKVAKILEEN